MTHIVLFHVIRGESQYASLYFGLHIYLNACPEKVYDPHYDKKET